MLAFIPASMVNQKSADLGIPNRFKINSSRFSYAPGRGAVHGLKLLEGYRSVVQCDGYAAYKAIADKAPGEAITLAFCWAHLRRHFFDIAKGGDAPIASEARSNASLRSMRSRRRSAE